MRALSHRQEVARLYKAALKLSRDWAVNRDIWRTEAVRIRQLFDANRAEQDPRTVKRLLDDTRAQLHEMRHPDPYRQAASPEGSKWERNTPPPPYVARNGFGDFHG